jgi:hypothetical protein
MERSSWALIACLAIGAAALVLGFIPGRWPNPLTVAATAPLAEKVSPLERAAASVDAACRKGDGVAFASHTTASYRQGLEERLALVDAALTDQTLIALSSASPGYFALLQRPVLALRASNSYAAVAVARQNGDGAQLLVFFWNGFQFCLDEIRHAPHVQDVDVAERSVLALLRNR